MMKFVPHIGRQASINKQIRIDPSDWAALESVAGKLDVTTAEVCRQAIHFAVENMEKNL